MTCNLGCTVYAHIGLLNHIHNYTYIRFIFYTTVAYIYLNVFGYRGTDIDAIETEGVKKTIPTKKKLSDFNISSCTKIRFLNV